MTTKRATDSSREGDALLQRRVALVGKVLFLLTLAVYSLRALHNVAAGRLETLLSPAYLFAGISVAPFLAMWLVCRSGVRSRRLVSRLEATSFVAFSVFFVLVCRYLGNTLYLTAMDLMAPYAPPEESHAYVASSTYYYMVIFVILGLTEAMVLRAALIPSSARRTLLVTLGAAAPIAVVTVLGLPPLAGDRDVMSVVIAQDIAVNMGFAVGWWGMTVAFCTIISKVIYTLSREASLARRLGQYTLQEKLGEGGMGVVYRATHAMMRRPTAVKLLPPDRAGEETIRRFEREVQLTAQLTHPNTITIFDFGRTPDGVFYYAMELLEGATIDEVVAVAGPLPPARVVRIMSMVAGALAEAHEIGLIHRDIKPSNIILCERGGELDVAKVVDFGLVKDITQPKETSLTQDGRITGTPQYMPPECVANPTGTDGRADLYALGAVGYYMLTGQDVFLGKNAVELMVHHIHDAPVPPSQRSGRPVPPDLEALVLECLAKAPDDRPSSARELEHRLRACREVGTWNQEQARAWWRAYGEEIRSRRLPFEDVENARTVAVALDSERD
jgi:serine/threonine-protein kinase